ncbi:hypothetical protein Purlil1_13435 [Purpureocillium lilacinum]|uniref:Uncharacterized protein n=1 Tax=Purpureocillium lilacinum TaxID=33203 RepID=A0ABR0BE35_PURLI|nr:hypothetical protein Purlil1_13435 [Purpureocillium lilacinum]
MDEPGTRIALLCAVEGPGISIIMVVRWPTSLSWDARNRTTLVPVVMLLCHAKEFVNLGYYAEYVSLQSTIRTCPPRGSSDMPLAPLAARLSSCEWSAMAYAIGNAASHWLFHKARALQLLAQNAGQIVTEILLRGRAPAGHCAPPRQVSDNLPAPESIICVIGAVPHGSLGSSRARKPSNRFPPNNPEPCQRHACHRLRELSA